MLMPVWIVLSILAGCEGDIVSVRDKDNDATGMAHDEMAGLTVTDWNFSGASATGKELDLQVAYQLDIQPSEHGATTLDLYTEVVLVEDGTETDMLGQSMREVADVDLIGSTEVAFQPIRGQWRLKIYARHRPSQDVLAMQVVDLPLQSTGSIHGDTSDVSQLAVVPVGSYVTRTENARREHRFSLRVADGTHVMLDEKGQIRPGDNSTRFVTGLEEAVGDHFKIYEDGHHDVESALNVGTSSNRVVVHFLLDGSTSIHANGHESMLRHAAASTIAQLAPFAVFRYQQFSISVREIASLRDYRVDTIPSGTALYYSMDKTLAWIRDNSRPTDYNVLVVFTDGKDLASPNYYEGKSQNDIAAYVLDKIVDTANNLQGSERNTGGAGLEVHLITLNEPSAFAPDLDQSVVFNEWHADNLDDVSQAFSAIANRIQGTYHLTYSSQRTVGNPSMRVVVEFINSNGELVSGSTELGEPQ